MTNDKEIMDVISDYRDRIIAQVIDLYKDIEDPDFFSNENLLRNKTLSEVLNILNITRYIERGTRSESNESRSSAQEEKEMTPEEVAQLISETHEPPQYDSVNHPAHYTDGKIEVIDFIEDKHLDFCLGNAVKYISRAGKKQDYAGQSQKDKIIEDLSKAVWYINRRIEQLQDKVD